MSEQLPASLKPDAGQTSDTRMLAKAIKERWPIPDEYREAIINRQIKIAIDPASSNREATTAAKAVFTADKLNLERLERESPTMQIHEHRITIDERRVELLGIVAALRERATVESHPVSANGQANGKISPYPHASPNGVLEP